MSERHANTPEGWRTKAGQKAEIFWMETRPTKSDMGKTQKMVKALWKDLVKPDGRRDQSVIPNTKTNDPILYELGSGA